jgi:DNA-binding response OmpR family regulator
MNSSVPGADGSKPRVLVIDDEPYTLDLVKLYFEMFGCEVTTAQTGFEGLKQIAAAPPDALILDLMLPDMDGLEVCRRLRDQPQTAALPVIMLSARTSKEDVRHGYAAGATLYMKKPVDLAKMLEDTKRVITVGHTPPPKALQDFHAESPATGLTPGAKTSPPAPPTE